MYGMYVLDVVPFSRSAPAGTLSYRSRAAAAPGTLVAVTLRRRSVHALVVSCRSVAEAKAELKHAHFLLASSKPVPEGMLPSPLLEAAAKTAAYHASHLGGALAALLAPYVHEDARLPLTAAFENGAGFEQEPVEGPLEERARAYGARIEAALGAHRTALLAVPTLAEAAYWTKALERFAPVVLTSALTPKHRLAAFASAFESPCLVIVTPSFAWLPLPLLGVAVVERASAGSWRGAQRPYLDMRRALLDLCEARDVPCLLGDYPLPLEYRARPDAPLAVPSVPATLVDARRTKEDDASGVRWKAVPDELRAGIAAALENGGRALVLAVRKGYAPSVVCRDCGQTLVDERGQLYTFSMQGGTRVLRTADGVSERPVETTCPVCGSWNLLPLGIGIERVSEELRGAFPNARVVELSGELRTQAAAKKALADASASGTIVVGTEAALPWLLALSVPRFDVGALASADSLLAVPFWRARERFVRLSFLLAQLCARLLIASRLPDDAAVRAATGEPDAFFAEESQLRAALGYPPFGTLIALQAEATKGRLPALDTAARNALAGHAYIVLPDRAVRGQTLRRSYVVRLPAGTWPDEAVAARLALLPPDIRVLIDPEAF